MIDDILGISNCGDESIELNAIINSKIEMKKLRLSDDKCYKIHICKKTDECSQILKVHEKPMKVKKQATYLGDVMPQLTKDAKSLLASSHKYLHFCQVSAWELFTLILPWC